jgi:hypothetical protein
MEFTTVYIGAVDGLHVWEVRDASTGEVVGFNRSPYPLCPGEGWVLDEDACVWVEVQ